MKHLSSGNLQKLGLILALMAQPEILIMDEPTLGLDPLLQNEIHEILRELKTKGTTIFISSHNLPEVERLCDRVGIIKKGKLIAVESIPNLKGKKIQTVNVQFDQKFKGADFEGDGLEIIQETYNGLILKVKGDVNVLVRKLSNYRLKNLEISFASLEDVFLEYYGQNNRKETNRKIAENDQ